MFGAGAQTKKLAACAVMAALLVVVQIALSFAAGVELVSLLLCAFCAVFGAVYGVVTALAFCLLRCLYWGFNPLNVQVLYFTYFPVFALVMGLYGVLIRKYMPVPMGEKKGISALKHSFNAKTWVCFIGLVAISAVLTACFTLYDDFITPKIMGYSRGATLTYFYASLPTLFLHVGSVSASVALLFLPVFWALERAKRSMRV